MGLALYLQLRDSRLPPGFCIHKFVCLLRYAWNSLNWNFCKPFADLRKEVWNLSRLTNVPARSPCFSSYAGNKCLFHCLFGDVPYISVGKFIFKMAFHYRAEVLTPRARKKQGYIH